MSEERLITCAKNLFSNEGNFNIVPKKKLIIYDI